MNFQKTIRKAVTFKGIGLHSGATTEVVLKPAPADSGITFVRTDVAQKVLIPALNQYVIDTTFSTTIGKNSVAIQTIEHLMAALWGLDIDNAEIEVCGPEIPILDGSSEPFVKKIKKAGIQELDQLKKVFVITKPIAIVEGDRYCYLLSSRTPKITCSIEFAHPYIQKQKLESKLDPKSFMQEIARARTFGFVKDIELLRQKGLIRGGSLDCAVVLDEKNIVNKEGLRFKDEFVRHKILDSIGDMALFGMKILGHFVTHKAGHELHAKLIRKVLTQECGYIIGEKAFEKAQQDRMPIQASLFQPASI
ncbi:MAG: UDP-3-O-acyl-N-acetylglucosamine deacetylase [Deltaproteobacteria bacterium]|nr:UDP-3-O-acyl-N-acetylglucosamine deacetylase [Deltaproteobacteria bacterium]